MNGSRAVAVSLLGLAACVGSGEGLDKQGRPLVPDLAQPLSPVDDGGAPVDAMQRPTTADASADERATLPWIQDNVFSPICAAYCHSGASAPQGLKLDPSSARSLLVGVASNEVKTMMRVKAGDPDQSYLYAKIVSTDPRRAGERMPRNGPYLDDAQIEAIRQWIARGALP